jgi:hypothetical protein
MKQSQLVYRVGKPELWYISLCLSIFNASSRIPPLKPECITDSLFQPKDYVPVAKISRHTCVVLLCMSQASVQIHVLSLPESSSRAVSLHCIRMKVRIKTDTRPINVISLPLPRRQYHSDGFIM